MMAMADGTYGVDDTPPAVEYRLNHRGEVVFQIGYEFFQRNGGVVVSRVGALAMIAELQRVIAETDRMLTMRDTQAEPT